ncbi:MAG: 1-acyl-sn-glycerol-3-phosphate acyltransferase [Crocinitomicaceae bacterium]|nr:1-acyl-sn-glycerol-3-phosphate acyltransferase [Crocinitomicaceae bacterium]
MKHIFLRSFYALLVRPWLKYIIGVNFQNREIFNDLDQYIIVANHNSHFDTVSIMAALPGKKIKSTSAVAAADYFGKTSLASRATNFFFNAILIHRKNNEGGPSTLDILDEQLKKGQSLVLFPEGSRGKPGVIKDFKTGIAVLLKQNPTIPFVPVYLDGFGRVLPKDNKLIIPLVCKVRLGSPIYPKNEDIDAILDEVKKAVLELKNNDERDRNQFEY